MGGGGGLIRGPAAGGLQLGQLSLCRGGDAAGALAVRACARAVRVGWTCGIPAAGRRKHAAGRRRHASDSPRGGGGMGAFRGGSGERAMEGGDQGGCGGGGGGGCARTPHRFMLPATGRV